jgi:hypothetical protein
MKRKQIVKQNPKKVGPGRPVTIGAERFVGMRLPTELLEAVDKWGAANEASRSEAFRRLVELGLAASAKRAKTAK